MDVRGIGASPDVVRLLQDSARSERSAPRQQSTNGTDDVDISAEASELANARKATAEEVREEIRQDRIEQARKNLEQGAEQVNAVLRAVAGRISPYI